MAKSSIPSPDEALAGMAKQGRTPMGKEGISFTSPSASPKAGTLVPKKGAQAADPSAQPKGTRPNVPYSTSSERNGASYGIKGARYTKQTDPSAGLTQANGRIIQGKLNRDRANYDDGASASY